MGVIVNTISHCQVHSPTYVHLSINHINTFGYASDIIGKPINKLGEWVIRNSDSSLKSHLIIN